MIRPHCRFQAVLLPAIRNKTVVLAGNISIAEHRAACAQPRTQVRRAKEPAPSSLTTERVPALGRSLSACWRCLVGCLMAAERRSRPQQPLRAPPLIHTVVLVTWRARPKEVGRLVGQKS
jgi:hypothetical protein